MHHELTLTNLGWTLPTLSAPLSRRVPELESWVDTSILGQCFADARSSWFDIRTVIYAGFLSLLAFASWIDGLDLSLIEENFHGIY